MNKTVHQLRGKANEQEQHLKELVKKQNYVLLGHEVRSYQQIIRQLAQFEQAERYWSQTARYYEVALKYITIEDNKWLIATLSDDLASVYNKLLRWGNWTRESTLQQLDKIIQLHKQSAQIYFEMGNYVSYAGVHINIVGIYLTYAHMHKEENAIEYLYQADEACHESITYRDAERHPRDYAMLQDNHGDVHLELALLENFDENIALAIEARKESSDIFQQIHDLHNYGISEGHLGQVYTDFASKLNGKNRREKLRIGVGHYRNALEHIDRNRDLTDFAFNTVNLANALSRLGEEISDRHQKLRYFDESIDLYSSAIDMMKEDAILDGRITAIYNLAHVHLQASEIEDSYYHLEQAEKYYIRVIKSNFSRFFTFSSYRFLAQIYKRQHKRDYERSAYRQLLQMSQKEDMPDNIESIRGYLRKTETIIEKILRWFGFIRY